MLIDHLLEGIFAVNGINKSSEEEKILYLKSLRKSATKLWSSYQDQKPDAVYDSKEAQECYLLRYFPPYSYFLVEELSQLEASYFEDKNSYTVSFFGAGPGPEMIGLLRFLGGFYSSSFSHKISKIKVNLFDQGSWNHSRKIIINHVIPKYWDYKNININSYETNFSSKAFWQFPENREKLIIKSDLVVFQNCFNEISPVDYGQTTENISGILDHLSDGSLIVFIDQEVGRYQSISDMLNQIINLDHQSSDIYTVKSLDSSTLNQSHIISGYPSIIDENIYYKENSVIGYAEGLVLRKNYPYSSLILTKISSPF